MINVNEITTTLRGMPDRLLQQYAMMNKGNPYVLSLAVAESNQRKQLRQAAQARNTMPQPKVADAAIAGMAEAPAVDAMGNVTGMAAGGLPEDHGIGRLPAHNIQHMADGGIAGYGDDANEDPGLAMGGSMFDFAQRSEPVLRMASGGMPGYADGVFNDARFREFLKAKGITGSQFANADIGEKQKILSEFGKFNSGPQAPAPTAATPTAATAASNTGKAYELGKAAKPYLDKAGNVIKTGTVPVIGGGLAALEGVSEIDRSKGFYEDPNVPTLEKAKQFGRTAANVGLPLAGGIIGSGITPVLGTAGGTALGAGLASYIDDKGDALQAWEKANPQAAAQAKKAPAKVTPTYSPDDQSNAEARRLGLKVNPNTMSATPEAAEDAGTGGGGGGGFGGGSSAQSVKDMYNLFLPQNQKDTRLNSIEQQYKDLAEARTSTAQRDYQQLQADLAARGEYGKDKEAKLKAKEERIGKEEGQAGGLALLEAGLAIMSGTSPHALANIGQGAMAGTAAYRKSQEKLADARDKLDDAYGRLEDVRFNQKSMDAKELRAAKKGVDDATNAGLESLINFTAKRFDIDRDEAGKLLNSYTQLRAHEISAAPGIARNKLLEKQFSGDAKKMAEYGKIQKQVMADLDKDIAYKTANTQAEKDKIMEARLRSAMMNNPFLSSYAMGIGFAAAPTNKVRNEDEDV